MAKITKTNSETKFIFFDNLDKVGEITLYYGFEPHKSPDIKKVDMDNAKSLLEGDFIEENNSDKKSLPLHVEEKICVLRKTGKCGLGYPKNTL
jgi:hypothetical protein